jgi:glycosyltransferase involved in cell wall biosynthesis
VRRFRRTGSGTFPVRVLFVQDHLGQSPEAIHGVGRYLLSTLSAFDRRLVEPSLCVLSAWHPLGAPLLEAQGIDAVFLGRGKWDPRALPDLIRLVRHRDIDILHVSGFKGTMLGRIAAAVTRRAAIAHLHDARPMAPWVRLVQHRLARWTDAAIVVSEAMRRVALADYGLPSDRVQVLHNGVLPEAYSQVPPGARRRIRQELGIEDDAKVIGIVGRIEPGKGHKALLRALPKVLARCSTAVLLVVGDGPAHADCERLAGDLGLTAAVRFTGYRSDIPELLSAMEVMAAPSIAEEGLGYAVLEAMCAGLPVVAYRSGGLAEVVVHGETGLLVPKGDVAKLAEALATVLTETFLRQEFAQGARRRVVDFSVTRHVERLQETYRDLMASCAAAPPHSFYGGVPCPDTDRLQNASAQARTQGQVGGRGA